MTQLSDYNRGADICTRTVLRELHGLCERQPDRKFQQILFDVHERIYNMTGISPECGDTEEATNRDYLNAIHKIREGRLMRDRIGHMVEQSIDDAFLEDSDEWHITSPDPTPQPPNTFSINSLLLQAETLCVGADNLEKDSKLLADGLLKLVREVIAIKHEIGEEF